VWDFILSKAQSLFTIVTKIAYDCSPIAGEFDKRKSSEGKKTPKSSTFIFEAAPVVDSGSIFFVPPNRRA
jgi:hypothetical protein